MAASRLSRLQCHVLAWLVTEEQRMRGTIAASYEAMVRTLVAIARTPGGQAEAVALTPEGQNRAASLTESCE